LSTVFDCFVGFCLHSHSASRGSKPLSTVFNYSVGFCS